MHLNRLRTQSQLGSDDLVRLTVDDQVHDLALSRGKTSDAAFDVGLLHLLAALTVVAFDRFGDRLT